MCSKRKQSQCPQCHMAGLAPHSHLCSCPQPSQDSKDELWARADSHHLHSTLSKRFHFSLLPILHKVFKIRLLVQDLVKESSNGLTGRAEEGWNIWQRREDLIPEEIRNYTQLFIEAKKVS